MKNYNIIINNTNESKRKKIHLLSCIIPLFYILFPHKILFFISLVVTLVLIIDCCRLYTNLKINYLFKKYLLNTIRNYEKNNLLSATVLIISFFFVILIFEKNIAIYSMSFAALCDAMAAILGMKYGKIKNYLNKSLEGSLMFLLTGILIICFYSLLIDIDIDIIYLLICLIVVTLIESITPSKYDNVTVPFSAAVLLTLFKIV